MSEGLINEDVFTEDPLDTLVALIPLRKKNFSVSASKSSTLSSCYLAIGTKQSPSSSSGISGDRYSSVSYFHWQ